MIRNQYENNFIFLLIFNLSERINMNYKSTVRACYVGSITLAIVNNLAPLLFVIFNDRFGLSFDQLGLLIFINFVTQIFADLLGSKYVDKIGYRIPCVAAHFFAVAGLVGLGLLPLVISPFPGLLISVVLYAFGAGLLEVMTSPLVDRCSEEKSAGAIGFLHSFFCWGQVVTVLVSTIILHFINDNYWFVLPLLWAIIPLVNAFNFMRVPLPKTFSEEEKTPFRKLLTSKLFILAIILMLCSGAAELSMSQWASFFAEKALAMSKVFGDIFGPCLFAVFMGIGRLLFGIYGEKINIQKVLLAGSVLCVICYLCASLSPLPIISLFACALTGLSVSLMWPGVLVLATKKFPKGGTTLFGILALCGDVGCSIGPWLVGMLSYRFQTTELSASIQQTTTQTAEQVGLKFGLLIAVIFPILMIICLLLFKKSNSKGSSEVVYNEV